MLKILLIPDADRFLEKVKTCSGDVILHLPDNSTCSLKSDHVAAQMIKMMDLSKDGLRLSHRSEGFPDYAQLHGQRSIIPQSLLYLAYALI